MPISFEIYNSDSSTHARVGELTTRHAKIETPQFMPVGTFGMVRGVEGNSLSHLGYQLLLTNTYHLAIRPGLEVLRKKGGLKGFSGWPYGYLSDSGGFQIFSLSKDRQITEKGAIFRSYLDGRLISLTPEFSMEIQEVIGSDIRMVLDECVPSTVEESVARAAMERTYRWAKRSRDSHNGSSAALFGIVQGARFPHLREESASQIGSIKFEGYAIGGLAVGEPKSEREDMTEVVTKLLPKDKPRYLMGVGMPIDLLEAVARGVDLFDCVLPGLLSQQGVAFGWNGKIDLRKGRYLGSSDPIDESCGCIACRSYERGYLSHLVKTSDHFAWGLIGVHNLTFLANLLSKCREAIRQKQFHSFYLGTREQIQGNEP